MQEQFDQTHLNREGIGNLLTAFEANTLLCYGDAANTPVKTNYRGNENSFMSDNSRLSASPANENSVTFSPEDSVPMIRQPSQTINSFNFRNVKSD